MKPGDPFYDHFSQTSPDWRPYVTWRALDPGVLVAAKTRIEGTWAAYIHSVPGENHEAEAADVLRHGSKLSVTVARALFPFDGVPYAN
jgi:hypothetical protein